ncbi:hypothetical protein P9112_013965 [Eukaryota sp. TZLM1-RC]
MSYLDRKELLSAFSQLIAELQTSSSSSKHFRLIIHSLLSNAADFLYHVDNTPDRTVISHVYLLYTLLSDSYSCQQLLNAFATSPPRFLNYLKTLHLSPKVKQMRMIVNKNIETHKLSAISVATFDDSCSFLEFSLRYPANCLVTSEQLINGDDDGDVSSQSASQSVSQSLSQSTTRKRRARKPSKLKKKKPTDNDKNSVHKEVVKIFTKIFNHLGSTAPTDTSFKNFTLSDLDLASFDLQSCGFTLCHFLDSLLLECFSRKNTISNSDLNNIIDQISKLSVQNSSIFDLLVNKFPTVGLFVSDLTCFRILIGCGKINPTLINIPLAIVRLIQSNIQSNLIRYVDQSRLLISLGLVSVVHRNFEFTSLFKNLTDRLIPFCPHFSLLSGLTMVDFQIILSFFFETNTSTIETFAMSVVCKLSQYNRNGFDIKLFTIFISLFYFVFDTEKLLNLLVKDILPSQIQSNMIDPSVLIEFLSGFSINQPSISNHVVELLSMTLNLYSKSKHLQNLTPHLSFLCGSVELSHLNQSNFANSLAPLLNIIIQNLFNSNQIDQSLFDYCCEALILTCYHDPNSSNENFTFQIFKKSVNILLSIIVRNSIISKQSLLFLSFLSSFEVFKNPIYSEEFELEAEMKDSDLYLLLLTKLIMYAAKEANTEIHNVDSNLLNKLGMMKPDVFKELVSKVVVNIPEVSSILSRQQIFRQYLEGSVSDPPLNSSNVDVLFQIFSIAFITAALNEPDTDKSIMLAIKSCAFDLNQSNLIKLISILSRSMEVLLNDVGSQLYMGARMKNFSPISFTNLQLTVTANFGLKTLFTFIVNSIKLIESSKVKPFDLVVLSDAVQFCFLWFTSLHKRSYCLPWTDFWSNQSRLQSINLIEVMSLFPYLAIHDMNFMSFFEYLINPILTILDSIKKDQQFENFGLYFDRIYFVVFFTTLNFKLSTNSFDNHFDCYFDRISDFSFETYYVLKDILLSIKGSSYTNDKLFDLFSRIPEQTSLISALKIRICLCLDNPNVVEIGDLLSKIVSVTNHVKTVPQLKFAESDLFSTVADVEPRATRSNIFFSEFSFDNLLFDGFTFTKNYRAITALASCSKFSLIKSKCKNYLNEVVNSIIASIQSVCDKRVVIEAVSVAYYAQQVSKTATADLNLLQLVRHYQLLMNEQPTSSVPFALSICYKILKEQLNQENKD